MISKNKQYFKGRFGHSSNLINSDLGDSVIYVFGGSEDKPKNDMIKFNLKSGVFSKVLVVDEESIPSSRDFHTSVYSSEQNKVYIIGVSYVLRIIKLLGLR